MKFEENLFRVLNVSIYDTKTKIDAQADDLSFADSDREEIIGRAQDILINPRKRIAAEVRQLVDENLDIENLSEDTLRGEIREEIQDAIKSMNHNERINFANKLADYYEFADEDVVIEDFFDCYRLETAAFINETTEKIFALLTKIKVDANGKFLTELTSKLTAFVHARRPIDKFSMAIGRNSFDESEKVFSKIRNTAIKLYNEKDLIDEPLIITGLLARNFSYLPKLAELIREDVKFLEDAKKNRPTKNFLDAKAVLETILSSIKDRLHFKNGFEDENIDFYMKIFRNGQEATLIEVMYRKGYKPDEWKLLNEVAASIYIQVGNALTWTRRADLAFEMFQKALAYAEVSGNEKFISLARKRVDEWRGIAKRNSSNWLWWIIGVIVVLYLCSH